MDYTNPPAIPAQQFLSLHDWVTPCRGERRGEQAQVVALYDLSAGQVARVEFQEGTMLECFTSILVPCEAPALLRVGKFALMRLWCPQTDVPGEIEIGSDRYRYHIVDNGSPHLWKCFRLHKLASKGNPDGHTVTILHSGQEDCTCGSHIFGTGLNEQGRCKHLQALHHLQMVERPEVEEPAPFPEGFDPFADEITQDDADHRAFLADEAQRQASLKGPLPATTAPVYDEIPF